MPPEPDPALALEDLTAAQEEALRSVEATLAAAPIGYTHLAELTTGAGHDVEDEAVAIAVLQLDWEERAIEAAASIIDAYALFEGRAHRSP